MDTYKFKKSKGIVVFKSKNEIQVNYEILAQIKTRVIPNLLDVEVVNPFEVNFFTNNYIPIKEYLKNNMSLSMMYSIISQTIDALRGLADEGLESVRLVLDVDYVFLDVSCGRILFIYEPYISSRRIQNYIDFWVEIIDTTKIKDVDIEEQCQQLRDYITGAHSKSLDDIYAYVNKTSNVVHNSTGKLYEKATDLKQLNLNNDDYYEPETTLLVQDGFKSTRLVNISKAFIIRRKNMERVELTKDYFVIGKSGKCDYTVIGNPAISRQHLVIHNKNNEFYIVDKGSTNRTNLNGITIDYNREYRIGDGDVLKIADEFFDFKIS